MPRRRRREAGVILGIVLILLVVVLLGGALALWVVRSDTASSGNDRQARALFDCAEQGLEFGKQYFGSAQWDNYLASPDVCATSSKLYPVCYPNGPLHSGTGASTANYPYTATINGRDTSNNTGMIGSSTNPLTYTVALFHNSCDGTNAGWFSTSCDAVVGVYSRCTDATGQSRSATAVIKANVPTNIDYAGQAGFGFRNQGNQN